MDENEVLEGYLDGLRDLRDELPEGNNRTESYRHGWRNGRDDRLARPRAAAETLRSEFREIASREAAQGIR